MLEGWCERARALSEGLHSQTLPVGLGFMVHCQCLERERVGRDKSRQDGYVLMHVQKLRMLTLAKPVIAVVKY